MITSIIHLIFYISIVQFKPDAQLSSVVINGTSTLHDWVMNVEQINTGGTLSFTDNVYQANNLSFSFPVKSLKSGKSAMDDNTYKAMNADKYPNVKFDQINLTSSGNGSYQAKGKLTITSNSKVVSFPVNVVPQANNRILVKGKYTFKMSNFGVEPPEVMWGTITTGDEVTIDFNVIFSES